MQIQQRNIVQDKTGAVLSDTTTTVTASPGDVLVLLNDNIKAKLTRLRQIRDADPTAFANLTAAQRDTQLFNALQDVAQALIWLGRQTVGQLDDIT